jgi:hypothetical protein
MIWRHEAQDFDSTKAYVEEKESIFGEEASPEFIAWSPLATADGDPTATARNSLSPAIDFFD